MWSSTADAGARTCTRSSCGPPKIFRPRRKLGGRSCTPEECSGVGEIAGQLGNPRRIFGPRKIFRGEEFAPNPEESSDGTVQEPSGERESLFPDLGAEANAPTPDALFEAFWSAYPKKKAKGDARKAWGQVLKRGAEPHTIVAAAHQYARERDGEDPQYTAYPATWLRSERYADEPDPMYQPPRQRAGSHQPYRNPTTYGSNPDPWA